ncbi:MAG: phospholipid carrier-dependent glycosyltransferase [Elusimicrobia bacterium]|nr:phospholipid carrier-dependent glycosyltransferase [Elusimicrobiota bacterium]
MIPALLYSAALLCLGLVQAARYFLPVFAPALQSSALLVVVVLLCTGTGRLALRYLVTHELSESEKTLIGCTLGLGILTQGMFALGIAGVLHLWSVIALLGGLWIVGFTEMKDVIVSLGANRNLLKERPPWTIGILALLAATFFVSWVPPHQYDSLVYHLPLAAEYARTGRIAPVEGLLFSHFPQNGEMLFTAALVLKSELLAQLFSWFAAALSLLWVFEMGKREIPLTAVLGACALLASHTAVMLLSSIAYVETIVMLWVTGAVLSFGRWRETAVAGRSPAGWLILSAIFAGFALGTKYYAGICVAALGGLLAWRLLVAAYDKRGQGALAPAEAFRDLLLFGATAGLVASPWLLKNLYFVGNPVFPFLYQYFPHRDVAWAGENARRYFEFLTEYGHQPGHFFSDLLKFPFEAATGSLRFGGGMDVLGDMGWGLVFGLLPAGVWAAMRNRTLRLLLIYAGLHIGAWFCTGVVLRFLVVIAPILCLLGAAGAFKVWDSLEEDGRKVLAAALTVLTVVNLGVFIYVHTVFNSWTVLFGVESKDEYLAHRLDYYACARWAREHLGNNDRILIVGEQRGYYVQQVHSITTPMAPNRFIEWANQAKDSTGLARLLMTEGRFTHVIMVPREAKRLAQYGIFDFTPEGTKNWKDMDGRWIRSLFATGHCTLYQLASPDAEAPSPPAPATR